MPARVDLTGQRFGELQVLGVGRERSASGDVYWLCRCSCGSAREFRGKNLRCGDAVSCGCRRRSASYRLSKIRDLADRRFGRLVAKELDHVDQVLGAMWRCACDCGQSKVIRGLSLTSGATGSCGCYRPRRHRDLAGRRYGKLVARERAGRSAGDALWRCDCDCGAVTEVIARSLVHGATRTCGGQSHFSANGKSGTREYRATAEQRRLAKKRSAGGSFTHSQIEELHALQQGCCAACRKALPLAKMHRDHITPVSAGGDSSIRNIQLLCGPCNLSKHARHPVEFMQSRGMLL